MRKQTWPDEILTIETVKLNNCRTKVSLLHLLFQDLTNKTNIYERNRKKLRKIKHSGET